jgi:hypothetical protein
VFRQETGWCKTEYTGVSVISMTSAKTFPDPKNLLKLKIDYGIC